VAESDEPAVQPKDAPEPKDPEAPEGAPAEDLREWFGGRPLPKTAHLVFGFFAPTLLACVTMWNLRAHTVDDAYISYRYARNFARGLGFVYNQGERIEGYTNFLWTLILGIGIKLGIGPDLLAKLLGAGCAIGTMWMLYVLESRWRPLHSVPCLSPWLLGSTTIFMGYAIFGLESPLFVLLVLLGIWLFEREERLESKLPWSGLVFGAAGLTRPEAPLFLGLMMLFLAGKAIIPLRRWLIGRSKQVQPVTPEEGDSEEPEDGAADPEDEDSVEPEDDSALVDSANDGTRADDEDARLQLDEDRPAVLLACITVIGLVTAARLVLPKQQPAVVALGWLALAIAGVWLLASLPRALFSLRNLMRGTLFLAPVCGHLLWRHSYYGSWLPNTLSAKTGDMRQQLAGGLRYLNNYVDHEGPVIYLMLFGFTAAILWRHRGMMACAAIVVCASLYVLLVGGDWMPIFRFMSPLQPFIFLLIGIAVRAIVEKHHKLVNYGLVLVALLTIYHRANKLHADQRFVLETEMFEWDTSAGGVSRWFADQSARRGREAVYGEIALGDIGQVGYETDMPILDLLGLVDPVIAKLPGGYTNKIGRGFRDRFFDKQPRYFILISAEYDCIHPSVTGSRVLYGDRRFAKHYTLSGRVALKRRARGISWCIYENRRFVSGPRR